MHIPKAFSAAITNRRNIEHINAVYYKVMCFTQKKNPSFYVYIL